MSDEGIQISEIATAPRPRRFGPFTSAVSFVAMVSLIVVMAVVLAGRY